MSTWSTHEVNVNMVNSCYLFNGLIRGVQRLLIRFKKVWAICGIQMISGLSLHVHLGKGLSKWGGLTCFFSILIHWETLSVELSRFWQFWCKKHAATNITTSNNNDNTLFHIFATNIMVHFYRKYNPLINCLISYKMLFNNSHQNILSRK